MTEREIKMNLGDQSFVIYQRGSMGVGTNLLSPAEVELLRDALSVTGIRSAIYEIESRRDYIINDAKVIKNERAYSHETNQLRIMNRMDGCKLGIDKILQILEGMR